MDSQPACLPLSSLPCSHPKNTNDRRRSMESKASSESYSLLTAGFRRLELRGAMIHHPTPVLMSLLPAHRLQQTSLVRISSSPRAISQCLQTPDLPQSWQQKMLHRMVISDLVNRSITLVHPVFNYIPKNASRPRLLLQPPAKHPLFLKTTSINPT